LLEAVLGIARRPAACDASWSLAIPHPWILTDGSGYTTAGLGRS
jgi:hypothetical protein